MIEGEVVTRPFPEIERNESIRFHEAGTLEAVTRWIAAHHDGLAEWLKNSRRQ